MVVCRVSTVVDHEAVLARPHSTRAFSASSPRRGEGMGGGRSFSEGCHGALVLTSVERITHVGWVLVVVFGG